MLRVLSLIVALTPLPLMAAGPDGAETDALATAAVRFAGIDGGDIALADYAGRPVLVTNTASLCGFTPQYAGLQTLWETYRDAGLVVIGVPTNDFGNQEPGTADEIKAFCEVNFDVDFPLTAKATTRGPERHSFFNAVAAELGEEALPRWNFYKFLVGADGQLKAGWPSSTQPMSEEVTRMIEAELAPRPSGS